MYVHFLVSFNFVDLRLCFFANTGYCGKHKNEELTFYCRTCLIAVCMRCRLTVHEDHTTEDLVDAAARTRRDLKLALDQNKAFRFCMLNDIDELRVYVEKLEEKSKETKNAITDRRQQFHKAVDYICDAMVARLEAAVNFENERVAEDKDLVESDMLVLSHKIATANQMVDYGSDIEVMRCRNDILGSLSLAKKEVPLSMTGAKLNVNFSCYKQAEMSLGYLIGRLSTDIVPPSYINVLEVSTFRVENTSDVINSICPAMDDKCWVACGWKHEIYLFDRNGKKSRAKKVGRDVDCLAIDTDGNSYVSCRDEQAVKRFDRNFRRRMATLNIEYPRGIATTQDNKLVICINRTTTYFDYEPGHENKVLKLGPDGDESKELQNPDLCFKYPIRVSVNTNNELCVSDNLKHAVFFLRPNGELKASYDGNRKSSEIAIVQTPAQRCITTAKTSTRGGAVSFKLPCSRKEQDGPLDTPKAQTVMERIQTPQNSPKTLQISDKELAPINVEFDSSFESYVTSDAVFKQIGSPEKSIPAYMKALSGMTGAMETASVTDVGSEIGYIGDEMPAFDPRGITCDRHGHVIVCDYSSNLVHLLDKYGRFLMYLLTEADGIFGPTSVAVDKAGFLWVGGGDATVKIFKYIDVDRL